MSNIFTKKKNSHKTVTKHKWENVGSKETQRNSSSVSNVRNRLSAGGIGSCSTRRTTSRSSQARLMRCRITCRQMHGRRSGSRTICRRWARNCSMAGFFPGRWIHFSLLNSQPALTRNAAASNSLCHVSQHNGEFWRDRLQQQTIWIRCKHMEHIINSGLNKSMRNMGGNKKPQKVKSRPTTK